MIRAFAAALFAAPLLAAGLAPPAAAETPVERGKYLVDGIGGCGDCHTAGHFFGKPDMARHLAGSDVGFAIPGLGVFVGPNLTPDPETGLGKWSEEDIARALTTGVRPDGRILAPAMPWRNLAGLSKADQQAIAAYLKSLKPVVNKVPGPLGPNETSPVFVLMPIPGQVYATLPKPK